ncbi:hypothetical protein [Spiroplasma alleghenense]|uniref:Transmembrane protein n=1 Tax=Spiroplasma alleghenense TaxID=216931 RepID=A0A345Z4P1_9MOLU|nr:hypothetical protein [Spiroplasma alleghenense]AXK51570.1 hypothetical protein SALLE_v1c09000 [Spiroplasma alleghenense]
MRDFVIKNFYKILGFINFLIISIFFIFYLFFSSNGINHAKQKMNMVNSDNLSNLLEKNEYYILINNKNANRVESILNGIYQDAFNFMQEGLNIPENNVWIKFQESTLYQKYSNELNYFDFFLEILNLPILYLNYQSKSFQKNDFEAVFDLNAISDLKYHYNKNNIINHQFWVNNDIDSNYFLYQSSFLNQSVKSLIGIINHDIENSDNKILSKKYSQSKNYYLTKRLDNFEIFLKKYEIKNYLNNLLISCYITAIWMALLIIEIIYVITLLIFLRFSENYYFHKYIQVIDR